MAGAGSRFFTQGYKDPKPLLDIEGLPMVIQAVKCLPETTNKIFICQNEHLSNYKIGKTINNYYLDSKILGIDYVTEGQACTCELAFKNYSIDDFKPIMISACDNGVYYNMEEYSKLLSDDSVDFIIWSFSNNPTSKLYPQMYAWLDVDENNYIKRVSIKKPFVDCENKYAIIGTMLFKKAKYFKEGLEIIYRDNLRTNGEFYVDNLIEPLIKQGYRAKIFDVTNYLCWGTPNDYRTYNYWYEYFINI
jgi:NDP-sugar pyrophosphorylase family protein